jgi:hypothetical protein
MCRPMLTSSVPGFRIVLVNNTLPLVFVSMLIHYLGLGMDDEEPDADQRYYFFELLRHFSCQPDYVILNFLVRLSTVHRP